MNVYWTLANKALEFRVPFLVSIGKDALALARTSVRNGGPGFEKDSLLRLVGRDWSKAQLVKTCASLHYGETYKNSWDWRIFITENGAEVCVETRLTRKSPETVSVASAISKMYDKSAERGYPRRYGGIF